MTIRLAQNLPQLVFETDTDHAHYQIWDIVYDGRPSRVLYTGHRQTAQSGVAVDDNHDLLFDYNQRFFELVCGILPRRLLLIGGGSYTLPVALLAVLPSLQIDVVEIDDQLEGLAQRFFGLSSNSRLHIIHGEGRQYLDETPNRYDIILLDAFADAETPSSLTDATATTAFKRCLARNGILAVNAIATYHGLQAKALHKRLAALQTAFKTVTTFPASQNQSLWLPQNLLLVGQLQVRDTSRFLRYPALELVQPYSLKRDLGQA